MIVSVKSDMSRCITEVTAFKNGCCYLCLLLSGTLYVVWLCLFMWIVEPLSEWVSECFGPEVAEHNFTRLEVKVIKLSVQDKFVLESEKFVPFLHKDCWHMGRCRKWGLKCFAPKCNRGHKTKKLDIFFKHTMCTSCAPVWQWWVQQFFSESVPKNKK